MNRTNTGANTNTIQMLLDTCMMLISAIITWVIKGAFLDVDKVLYLAALGMVFTLIFILSNKQEYLYNVTLFYYLDRIHRRMTKSFLIATLATVLILQVSTRDEFVRQSYLTFLIVSYVVVCVKIFFNKKIDMWVQRKSLPRTAFVGTVGAYNKFRYFLDKTSIALDFVGFIATTKDQFDDAQKGTYIGYLDELENVIRESNLDQIYIIQKHGEELAFTQNYVDLCIDMGVTVRLIVDFYKRRRANSYVSSVGTYPVITYHTVALNTWEKLVKRVFDFLGGLFGVILTLPIMLVTAIAIKLDSPGPIIFKQVRVGQNGRHFHIYKFRSMYIDAEERKKELMAKNEIAGGIMFKMKDDPRITKVGKVIRKYSIDELPQFFNILFGSMSLVGTRPPTIDEVEQYQRRQWRRISIKPGLTGMWQVSGRSNIKNFDEIVRLDTEYIDNWSLKLDLKILFKTVLVVLKHDDAY